MLLIAVFHAKKALATNQSGGPRNIGKTHLSNSGERKFIGINCPFLPIKWHRPQEPDKYPQKSSLCKLLSGSLNLILSNKSQISTAPVEIKRLNRPGFSAMENDEK